MQTLHAFGKALIAALAVCLSRTATAAGTGVDLRDYTGTCAVILDAGAATAGTNPTLDLALEESDDNSAWTAVPVADLNGGAFTQVTTVAGQQIRHLDMDKRKRYLRASWTIGGTSTPTFPFGIVFLGQKQYA